MSEAATKPSYGEDSVRTLPWHEHIRLRPGMYIGRLGDGLSHDDGIYVLLKEAIDNSIDEFAMGNGKKILVALDEKIGRVSVRDFGRGIPLGKLVACASEINTGAKYDSGAFQKSVGLNGVGLKAVNALSDSFEIFAVRDGYIKRASFSRGVIDSEGEIAPTSEKNGTGLSFIPDGSLFKGFRWLHDYVDAMLANYSYLNIGLEIRISDSRGEKSFISTRGLLDFLEATVKKGGALDRLSYPIIHLKGPDIEIAISHGQGSGEEIHSFVNGQNTHQGGTHVAAFREAYVKTIRDFFGKDYDAADVRCGIVAAISVRVQEPVFESQTKTKLGSTHVAPDGATIKGFVMDFLKRDLDNFLHKSQDLAKKLQEKILANERERKELAGIKDIARDRAKRVSLRNPKLRDCLIHYNSTKDRRFESTLFITEGDSAAGSISASRDANTQAVFTLRGKPLNSHGKTKRVVYENEEFYLLQAALNIEGSLEDLRYNRVVMATDADVDGMHIRLLLTTFFLRFFPELVREGHVYVLQTPLFRVRNKSETLYCYSETERDQAAKKLGGSPEMTRFKGLGEIDPEEFRAFIGQDIKLDPVVLGTDVKIDQTLDFYMGANTIERQRFICDHLVIDVD